MSDLFLQKVLPKLGILCFEYHSEGYFSCLGESPDWAMELFSCVRNRFPKILPCDISPFLENFIVDAEEFWQQNNGAVMRSGYWTESIQTAQKTPQIQSSEINLEALVLTIDDRRVLLLEVSEVKFFETFHWLQTARTDRLDSMVELKESASQMMNTSLFDALTGLPNERAFYIQMSQCLEALRQNSTQQFFLIKLNIDYFQSVNATLGQDWGDQCLIQLAQRLKHHCHEPDVVARLGADDFGVLIHCAGKQAPDDFLRKLIADLRSPYQHKPQRIFTTTSIGVLQVAQPNDGVEQCMGNVSLALKQAKSWGRGQSCFYDDELRNRQIKNLTLKQNFLTAIEHQALVAEYRPLFSRHDNCFIGFEPVLEWPLAEQAYSSTEALRELARSTGVGSRLSSYIIESCLTVLRDGQRPNQEHRNPNYPLTILLHCYPEALFDPNYEAALRTLKEHCSGEDQLILNLTDLTIDLLIDELDTPLKKLAKLNIQLCMPLSEFTEFPQLKHWSQSIQMLSIDPSRNNLESGSKLLAHPAFKTWRKSKNQSLLAVQVNHQAHDPIIADLGVDLCCGDFFSEPLPSEELISLLRSQPKA